MSHTPPTPHPDADVQLVASTFITEAKKNPVSTATPPWMGVQTRMLLGPTEHDIARAVLNALTAAGWRRVAAHLLPLLDLTAAELAALTDVAEKAVARLAVDPVLRAALDKLSGSVDA